MAKASVAFQRVCETFKIVELNVHRSATLLRKVHVANFSTNLRSVGDRKYLVNI